MRVGRVNFQHLIPSTALSSGWRFAVQDRDLETALRNWCSGAREELISQIARSARYRHVYGVDAFWHLQRNIYVELGFSLDRHCQLLIVGSAPVFSARRHYRCLNV